MRDTLNHLVASIRRSPSALALARGITTLIPDVYYVTNMTDVGPLRIRLRRHRYHLWEHPLSADQTLVSMFARVIRPGDVVYDVGANIGLFTRVFIHWFGARYVVAFEPMTGNLDLLRDNVALGSLQPQVDVTPVALSDHDGIEELQIDDMMSGSAVLNSVSHGAPSSGRAKYGLPPATERVTVQTLSTFLSTHSPTPPKPDVMKIDTEGAEVIILQGARAPLLDLKPRLAIALHGQDKALGTLSTLQEYGCFAYGYVRTSTGVSWQRLDPSDSIRLGNNNILASWRQEDVADPIQLLTRAPRPR